MTIMRTADATVLFVLSYLFQYAAANFRTENYHLNDYDLPSHTVDKREVSTFYISDDEYTTDYWIKEAEKTIKDQLNRRPIEGKAKNIIMFLGDGMSVATIAAARAYSGQLNGVSGEGSKLSFEEFPYTGLSKTYCVDKQVADSACSATAYLCGVKANYGTIGVSAAVKRDACGPMNNHTNHVDSIGRWAQLAGKATGIVTTTRITHASPSGVYAHTAERNWESDLDVEEDGFNATECPDIATQLIYGATGANLNIILGGGRKKFIPKDDFDEEMGKGERLDGINLIEEWIKIKESKGHRSQYAWNKEQLLKVNADTEYLLGLFENDHLQYHLDANHDIEPTLAEMTEAAVKILRKNSNGFFLFVEGGRIDHAHHETRAHKALDEVVQFSEAILMARNMTNVEDTLIVVTSDHAHTMTLNGYSNRGSNIFGIAGKSSQDNLPYSTLSYANGPGYKKPDEHGNRYDISQDKMGEQINLTNEPIEVIGGIERSKFMSQKILHEPIQNDFIDHALRHIVIKAVGKPPSRMTYLRISMPINVT